MPEPDCACQKFQRLEGASTQAYTTKYLERLSAEGSAGRTRYRCHVCGARWERVESEIGKRPSLVRLDAERPAS